MVGRGGSGNAVADGGSEEAVVMPFGADVHVDFESRFAVLDVFRKSDRAAGSAAHERGDLQQYKLADFSFRVPVVNSQSIESQREKQKESTNYNTTAQKAKSLANGPHSIFSIHVWTDRNHRSGRSERRNYPPEIHASILQTCFFVI